MSSTRTSERLAGSALGLLLGVLVTWLLVMLTGTLVVPVVAGLVGAALVSRWRRDVAVGLAVGALVVTAFFAWLFSVLGNGLEGF